MSGNPTYQELAFLLPRYLTPGWPPVENPLPGGNVMKHTIMVLVPATAVVTQAKTQKNGPVQRTRGSHRRL